MVFKEGESDYFQNPAGVCGTPRVVYHGADADSGLEIVACDEHGAIWFRSDQSKAERLAGKKFAVIPAFLRIENGLELEPDNFSTLGTAIAQAKARGNDGLFWRSGAGDYTYAVFSPEQVKSPLIDQVFDRGKTQSKGARPQNCREPQKDLACKFAHGVNPSDGEAGNGTTGKQVLPIGTKPFGAICKKIKSLNHLALFAGQLRESDDEERLYVFLDREAIVDYEKGGRILSEPSGSFTGKYLSREIERLKSRIKRLGASSFYQVDARSSGNPKICAREVMASRSLAASIPQYRGRITIISNTFRYLDSSQMDPEAEKPSGQPQNRTCSMELAGLRGSTETVKGIVSWAKALTQNRFAPLLIYTGIDKEVCGLQPIHPHDFIDISLIRSQMGKKLDGFGASGAIALLPKRVSQDMLDAARYYVQARILDCAIGFYGQSAYFIGQIESGLKEI